MNKPLTPEQATNNFKLLYATATNPKVPPSQRLQDIARIAALCSQRGVQGVQPKRPSAGRTGRAQPKETSKSNGLGAAPGAAFVTGCAKRYPMVDRNDRRIQVGDRIRYQHCTGSYGQTAVSEAVVTESHYPYGQIGSAAFYLDFGASVLRGYHRHDDWEHGHETWVEVLTPCSQYPANGCIT